MPNSAASKHDNFFSSKKNVAEIRNSKGMSYFPKMEALNTHN